MKSILVLTMIAAMIAMATGCEDNSNVRRGADGSPAPAFRINPEVTSIDTNLTSVVLAVVGGEAPFRWEMSDPALGILTGTNGFSRFVNYAPLSTNRAVNTLRVRDANQWKATALIAHGF